MLLTDKMIDILNKNRESKIFIYATNSKNDEAYEGKLKWWDRCILCIETEYIDDLYIAAEYIENIRFENSIKK